MTEGGEVLTTTVNQVWKLENILPHWPGIISFFLIFGGLMYWGKDSLIEKINGLFIIILLAAFIGLLILGGILVMEQMMNIGQFVAAEIIIIMVLASVEKLILSLETIYDVLTSLEK